MGKLLTVAIAAYNVEKFIDQCLFSFTKIKNLRYVEVLIINDGSTDQSSKSHIYMQKDIRIAFS